MKLKTSSITCGRALASPLQHHVFSFLLSILAFVADGTYKCAMSSDDSMKEFVEHLTHEFDNAANMDW